MITYSSSSKFWQRPWFLPLCGAVVAALAVGGWWFHGRAGEGEGARGGQEADPLIRASVPVPAPMASHVVLADGRPSDFTAEEWSALKDAMSKTAQPEVEMKRVVAFLRFQKAFDQWQSLKESPDTARRQQLATVLAEQVPERLRQGEVTFGEALLLQQALLADAEPDADRRALRLKEAETVLRAAAPQMDADQQAREAAQLKEYKRREAAILQEFQARPEPRDQAWLEAQLDAARRAVYGN